jgi:hypothetical protein
MKCTSVLAVAICLSSLCLLASAAATSASAKFDEHVSFSSKDLKIVEQALPTLKRERPQWTTYDIAVFEQDDSYLVHFYRPEDDRPKYLQPPPEKEGGPLPPPHVLEHFYIGSIWVEERKSDLRVMRVLPEAR